VLTYLEVEGLYLAEAPFLEEEPYQVEEGELTLRFALYLVVRPCFFRFVSDWIK